MPAAQLYEGCDDKPGRLSSAVDDRLIRRLVGNIPSGFGRYDFPQGPRQDERAEETFFPKEYLCFGNQLMRFSERRVERAIDRQELVV